MRPTAPETASAVQRAARVLSRTIEPYLQPVLRYLQTMSPDFVVDRAVFVKLAERYGLQITEEGA